MLYMCMQSEQSSTVSAADSSKKPGEHAGACGLHNADVCFCDSEHFLGTLEIHEWERRTTTALMLHCCLIA